MEADQLEEINTNRPSLSMEPIFYFMLLTNSANKTVIIQCQMNSTYRAVFITDAIINSKKPYFFHSC